MKKSTAGPTFPPQVRRVKHISLGILNLFHTGTVGESDDGNDCQEGYSDTSSPAKNKTHKGMKINNTSTMGVPSKRRISGASDVSIGSSRSLIDGYLL